MRVVAHSQRLGTAFIRQTGSSVQPPGLEVQYDLTAQVGHMRLVLAAFAQCLSWQWQRLCP